MTPVHGGIVAIWDSGMPNGHRSSDGTPTSITFQGRLFEEAKLLAFAKVYQEATAYHRGRPSLTRG